MQGQAPHSDEAAGNRTRTLTNTCASVSSKQVTAVPGLGKCPGSLGRCVDPRGQGLGEEQR